MGLRDFWNLPLTKEERLFSDLSAAILAPEGMPEKCAEVRSAEERYAAERLDKAEELIDQGFRVYNWRDANGNTPLLHLVKEIMNKNPSIFEEGRHGSKLFSLVGSLLFNGALPAAENNAGERPIDFFDELGISMYDA